MSVNMDYCRMANTSRALDQCIEGIKNQDITSKTEVLSGIDMFNTLLEFFKDNGIIEGHDAEMVNVLMNDSYIPQQHDDEDE